MGHGSAALSRLHHIVQDVRSRIDSGEDRRHTTQVVMNAMKVGEPEEFCAA
jgi:hypothetical protein